MIRVGSFSKCALFGAIALTVGDGVVAGAEAAFDASEQAERVSICHYDGMGRVRLLTVSENASIAHSGNHGDHAPLTFFADADGDGYGSGAGDSACTQPPSTATVGGDCDDSDAAINPGAAEVCGDNTDNNCDGQLAAAKAVQMLEYIPQIFDGSFASCSTVANVTVQVCRETPTQTVKLSSTEDGTGPAYFDELGTVVVTAPDGSSSGANYRWWEANCLVGGYPDIYKGYLPAQLDITDLFGDKYGIFDVNLRVRNAYQPYQWFTTYVVPIN